MSFPSNTDCTARIIAAVYIQGLLPKKNTRTAHTPKHLQTVRTNYDPHSDTLISYIQAAKHPQVENARRFCLKAITNTNIYKKFNIALFGRNVNDILLIRRSHYSVCFGERTVFKMFGYVRVLEGELKVKEYALYKSVYCGLCKTMKKYTHHSSTLLLTYDFTFLALFRAAMTDSGFELRKSRCGIHPFKKRSAACENDVLRYCAGASAVLNYHKLLDDARDGDKRGFKRIGVRALLPVTKRHFRSAVKKMPEYNFLQLSEKVSDHLVVLTKLEQSSSNSPDACADAFGNVLAAVFSASLDTPEQRALADKVGYHIGKWIYFADAANDFEKDKKSGCFNPFVSVGYEALPTKLLSDCMTMELGAAYDLMTKYSFKYTDVKNIILNAISLGMPNEAHEIFSAYEENNAKRSEERNAENA